MTVYMIKYFIFGLQVVILTLLVSFCICISNIIYTIQFYTYKQTIGNSLNYQAKKSAPHHFNSRRFTYCFCSPSGLWLSYLAELVVFCTKAKSRKTSEQYQTNAQKKLRRLRFLWPREDKPAQVPWTELDIKQSLLFGVVQRTLVYLLLDFLYLYWCPPFLSLLPL